MYAEICTTFIVETLITAATAWGSWRRILQVGKNVSSSILCPPAHGFVGRSGVRP